MTTFQINKMNEEMMNTLIDLGYLERKDEYTIDELFKASEKYAKENKLLKVSE